MSRLVHIPVLLLAVLAALLPAGAVAQDGARSVVSGHVYCGDTNGPARLAQVMLTPVRGSSDAPGTTTLLDGSFLIAAVPPGRYLASAELPGYLSPFSLLDANVRNHLESLQRPPAGSVLITVTHGLPVSLDLTLERGATVSGTILYDDGSPAIGMLVGVERRNARDAWEPVVDRSMQAFSFFSTEPDPSTPTDSSGHFRIDGLPPGTYIVHAHVPEQTVTVSMAKNPALGVFDHPGERLDVYSGNAFWPKQAKAFAVGRGEDVEADLEVPVGRLQAVSGSLVSEVDGHLLTEGAVTLTPRDDPGTTRTTQVGSDGRFRFLYVPPGDYMVKAEATGENGRPAGTAEISVHVEDEEAVVTLAATTGASGPTR